MLEYTEYVDPKYAEKIMAESLSLAEEPAPASPRKGPASETAEPVPSRRSRKAEVNTSGPGNRAAPAL